MKKYTHIIPLNDTYMHCAQSTCECSPLPPDELGVIVHNADDARERFERQGLVNDDLPWVSIGEQISI